MGFIRLSEEDGRAHPSQPNLSQKGEVIRGQLQYNTELFKTETASRFITRFELVLRLAVSRPDQALSAMLDAISEADRLDRLQRVTAAQEAGAKRLLTTKRRSASRAP